MSRNGLVLLKDRDADSPDDLGAVGTCSADLSKPGWEHGAFEIGLTRSRNGAFWVDRPVITGNPTVGTFVSLALPALNAGGWVQGLNEPDLTDVEHWQGGPESYHPWLRLVLVALPAELRSRFLHGPISGAGDLNAWVDRTWPGGYAVHVYGTSDQMVSRLDWYLAHTTGPLVVTELNPGAGQRFDLAAWAKDDLVRFLAYCASQPRVLAVLYFAHRWDQSPSLPSSVDAADCPTVVGALRNAPEVTAIPKETPMLRFADISNYQGLVDMSGWKAAKIDGVVVRVSEDGSPLDPFAPANVAQARERGLLVGLYHLTDDRYATVDQSLGNFQGGIDNIGGLQTGDVIVNDAEQGVEGDRSPWQAQWGRGAALKWGYKALFYSAPWWMVPHRLDIEGVAVEYAGLWEAKYTGDPNTKPDDLPGWAEVMVQYTASGSVPGVNGNVDLSTFLGSREDWLKLGKPGAVESPQADPVAEALAELDAAVARVKVALGR